MKNLNNRFEMHLYQRMDNQLRIQLNWKIHKPLFEEIVHGLYHKIGINFIGNLMYN